MAKTKTVTEHIRDHLGASLGMPARTVRVPDLDALRRCQWCSDFDRLRLNRMLLGAFRYGIISRGAQERCYDNIGSIVRRVRAYEASGNMEHLLDVANLAMIEWMTSTHPKRHFRSEDDGVHTEPSPRG
jgi:hypothetical protein